MDARPEDVLKLTLRNWRCVESLEVKIGKANLFIGKNSTGKSSVAYAIYIASRASAGQGPDDISRKLLGKPMCELARFNGKTRYFPVSICLGDAERIVEITLPAYQNASAKCFRRLWNEEYLVPSSRYGLITLAQPIIRRFYESPEHEYSYRDWFKSRVESSLAPWLIFEEDLRKVSAIELQPKHIKGLGISRIFMLYRLAGITFTFSDETIEGLTLEPAEAPSGLVDAHIIHTFVDRAKENSLLVIEEPEEHQNPRQQIDLTRELIKQAVDKNLTLIITTHSEILLHTLAKLVEGKEIKSSDIKIYYFKERTKEQPWVSVNEIMIRDDGTMDPIPYSLEVTRELF